MLTINPGREVSKIDSFFKTVIRKEKISDVLIGISGGVDSATSAALAVRNFGKDHVHPVLLPYGKLNAEAEEDARIVIKHLKIPTKNVRKFDIKQFTDTVKNYDRFIDEGRLGNIMARMRMIILFDLSKKTNFLVLGTENKTEHLLGYYTRFGDEASDIEPLRKYYKTQVYELAKFLRLPSKVLKKAPSAGLWQGQTDELEFGFPYKFADEVLYLHFDKGKSKAEIVKIGYDKQIVERVWWWIKKGEFKDRVPYEINL